MVNSDLRDLLVTAVDLHKQGHLPQAELLYKTILKVDPQHGDALHLLGVMAHGAGEYSEACELIGRAIRSQDDVPQYYYNRGVSLQALRENLAAAESYRQAVRLKADYGEAWENLGVALQDVGDIDAARDAYQRAIAIDDRSPIAQGNLGTLLLGLGLPEEALGHFDRALAANPALPEARSKRATALLALGNFQEGWVEHEWRLHADSFVEHNPVRIIPFAKWDGSPLSGKSLLINAEQGIGDEIMFASCYPDVIERAGACIIESDPRLVPILARSFPDAQILPGDKNAHFSWSASLPQIDFRIPAGSLPRFFRSSLEAFPSTRSYLRCDAERLEAWRQRLTSLERPLNIGISWTGGKDPRSSKARSIPLERWRPIFAFDDANFINLQYGDHDDEIDAFHRGGAGKLHSLEGIDPLKNLDEFAALIAALDLVVSIDNSTVFMAGALGVPVWVLLPSAAEWRWLTGRDTSVWYPSARLFRQRAPGPEAWQSVVQQVAEALHERG
jgi:tetratricopeptide (TPR) repeat protein